MTAEPTTGLTPINVFQPGRRIPYDGTLRTKWMKDMVEDEFWEIMEAVWDYTAVSLPGLYNLYHACKHVIENRIEGDIVECGVFFGGSIMFIAEVFRRHDYSQSRRILGFDTFYGFVRRSEHDVDFNGAEVCKPNDPRWNFGKEARGNVASIGFDPTRLLMIEGDVFDTLPATIDRPIALLRLDTDTYDTTKFELEHCWAAVATGAPVIIDDYGWCLGARKATDDFLNGKGVFLNRVDGAVRSCIKP